MANTKKYHDRKLVSFCCEAGLLEAFKYHCWDQHRTMSARLSELMLEALKAAKAKQTNAKDGRL